MTTKELQTVWYYSYFVQIFERHTHIHTYKTLSNKRFSKVLVKNHSKPKCVIVMKEKLQHDCLRCWIAYKVFWLSNYLTSLKILEQYIVKKIENINKQNLQAVVRNSYWGTTRINSWASLIPHLVWLVFICT